MISAFTPEQAEKEVGQMMELLIDAVDSGASIGFMPPVRREEALAYWSDVIAAMRAGRRLLLVAVDGALAQGSGQIDLGPRADGNHRGEGSNAVVHCGVRVAGLRQ